MKPLQVLSKSILSWQRYPCQKITFSYNPMYTLSVQTLSRLDPPFKRPLSLLRYIFWIYIVKRASLCTTHFRLWIHQKNLHRNFSHAGLFCTLTFPVFLSFHPGSPNSFHLVSWAASPEFLIWLDEWGASSNWQYLDYLFYLSKIYFDLFQPFLSRNLKKYS